MTLTDSPAVSSKAKPVRVLVCDDQPDVLEAMRLLLKGHGCQTVTVDSPHALLAAAQGDSFDLILVDLNYTRDTTSGQEGLDLLANLDAQGNTAPVVVMTAWGSVDLAVEAMRRGACDFIQKPWDNDRVMAVVRKQVESERRRRSELEIAANVQQKLFPRQLHKLETLDFAGHCVAAREVGGDYYDFLEAAGHGFGFVLADVSGKGVPAALLMANLQAYFRSQSANALADPAGLLQTVNRHFYESTTAERFVTLFFGVYDDRSRKLRYVNCGHVAPLLLRASGQMEKLAPSATMIGAFPQWSASETVTDLQRGDTLVLYSDGVTEAWNERGDEFGEDRLIRTLRDYQGQAADRLVHGVVERVVEFSHGSRSDDVTVVGLRGI